MAKSQFFLFFKKKNLWSAFLLYLCKSIQRAGFLFFILPLASRCFFVCCISACDVKTEILFFNSTSRDKKKKKKRMRDKRRENSIFEICQSFFSLFYFRGGFEFGARFIFVSLNIPWSPFWVALSFTRYKYNPERLYRITSRLLFLLSLE